ncbi:WSC domain-containing protein 1-like [Amphibalanus amphitrite]|uniref:WSC domain-containing protein 1-like n=1 Tax=Amphibalanus amphitrite TaxID=1232801 RepID=UPI001C912788|nr:WSC domain-containing protein 1-like [Amphibalanus amphitrite]XP_043188901.1 WSC domain-containing protein 1-like [Amphibalanus amphitrite]XP_043188902.1 WSC domain-containing protein 1-like [Amphibalanus amphitrite]
MINIRMMRLLQQAFACYRRKRVVRVLLLFFAVSAATIYICSDHQISLQQFLLSSDVSGTGGGDGTETLVVPVSRLVEPSLPTQSWFAGDPSCAHLVTQFGRPGSLPDARLASLPRSGNTWTRYLLEAATGLVTCGPTKDAEMAEELPAGALPAAADIIDQQQSATTSTELRAAGFIAEHVSPLTRTCLVGKTHEIPPAWRYVEGEEEADYNEIGNDSGNTDNATSVGYQLPAILLVRDPFRSIISLRHLQAHARMLVTESRATAEAFSGDDWRQYVERKSRLWFILADEWAEGPRHTLLVSYERLVAEPAVQLRRMLHFLGVTPAPERLGCTLRHKEGAFRNTEHPVLPSEDVYDADLRRMVWERIRLLDDTLASRGYQRLPLQSYAFYQP